MSISFLGEIFELTKNYVWGFPLVFLLLFTGIWYTFLLGFLPLRYLGYGFRIALGFSTKDGKEAEKEQEAKGDISYFQSLATVLAATIGTGNIVGVAGAILIGGPGALFWMWISAILGMSTKYAEALLAVSFREKTPHGYSGGPMYYMTKGLGWKKLAVFFSLMVLFAGLGIGNLAQVNAATTVLENSPLALPRPISAFFIAFATALVILGGIRRIAQVTAFLVPFMAILYLFAVISFLWVNKTYLPEALKLIFQHAFTPLSVFSGSFVGWFFVTVRTGLQHALFSNEAGLGSSPMADAASRTEFPVKQGLVSMIAPFLDTILICTMTGLTVVIGLEKNSEFILSQATQNKSALTTTLPAILEKAQEQGIWQSIAYFWGTQAAELKGLLVTLIFQKEFGDLGQFAIACSLFFFAVSTIFGWYLYTDRALWFLGWGKKIQTYQWLYVALVFLGGVFRETKLIWDFSHIANGLMAFPNLFALIFLSSFVSTETKKYFRQYPHRHDLAVRIYIWLLTILPKNTLSKIFGFLARLQLPSFIMIPILVAFSRLYKINVDEAELELKDYRSLNNFFTRALKNTARVIAKDAQVVVSPVDGTILHFGNIQKGQILQSKGISCTIEEILGNKKYLEKFQGGCYVTIYLSPKDYHRIHSPASGKILGYYYQPGKLFPVNTIAVNTIEKLFSRNERLISFLDTGKGLIALVKIGATTVGKIKVTYDEKLSTNKWIRLPRQHSYEEPKPIEKGQELGRFEMGSTVILLFERNTVELLDLEEKQKVRYGEPIAIFKNK